MADAEDAESADAEDADDAESADAEDADAADTADLTQAEQLAESTGATTGALQVGYNLTLLSNVCLPTAYILMPHMRQHTPC